MAQNKDDTLLEAQRSDRAGAPERVAVHPGLTDDAHTWMDLEVIAAELDVQRTRWDNAQTFVDAE